MPWRKNVYRALGVAAIAALASVVVALIVVRSRSAADEELLDYIAHSDSVNAARFDSLLAEIQRPLLPDSVATDRRASSRVEWIGVVGGLRAEHADVIANQQRILNALRIHDRVLLLLICQPENVPRYYRCN